LEANYFVYYNRLGEVVKLETREIPNYGHRYPHGEAIATGCVASTVHQGGHTRFGKQQQRPWSKPGAPLLLQTRVKTLDRELGVLFKRWYPDMDMEVEERPAAA
jgi:hypothetical protein